MLSPKQARGLGSAMTIVVDLDRAGGKLAREVPAAAVLEPCPAKPLPRCLFKRRI
jgi:hypothetical protein